MNLIRRLFKLLILSILPLAVFASDLYDFRPFCGSQKSLEYALSQSPYKVTLDTVTNPPYVAWLSAISEPKVYHSAQTKRLISQEFKIREIISGNIESARLTLHYEIDKTNERWIQKDEEVLVVLGLGIDAPHDIIKAVSYSPYNLRAVKQTIEIILGSQKKVTVLMPRASVISQAQFQALEPQDIEILVTITNKTNSEIMFWKPDSWSQAASAWSFSLESKTGDIYMIHNKQAGKWIAHPTPMPLAIAPSESKDFKFKIFDTKSKYGWEWFYLGNKNLSKQRARLAIDPLSEIKGDYVLQASFSYTGQFDEKEKQPPFNLIDQTAWEGNLETAPIKIKVGQKR